MNIFSCSRVLENARDHMLSSSRACRVARGGVEKAVADVVVVRPVEAMGDTRQPATPLEDVEVYPRIMVEVERVGLHLQPKFAQE